MADGGMAVRAVAEAVVPPDSWRDMGLHVLSVERGRCGRTVHEFQLGFQSLEADFFVGVFVLPISGK
jgi:hypothetical protein